MPTPEGGLAWALPQPKVSESRVFWDLSTPFSWMLGFPWALLIPRLKGHGPLNPATPEYRVRVPSTLVSPQTRSPVRSRHTHPSPTHFISSLDIGTHKRPPYVPLGSLNWANPAVGQGSSLHCDLSPESPTSGQTPSPQPLVPGAPPSPSLPLSSLSSASPGPSHPRPQAPPRPQALPL